MCSRSSQYVEVQLEIGHRATPKAKPTADGHTHDWTVFVRGPESSGIQHFVEKVVFHLHDSFPKPKRVVKETPYSVSESGYAGFELPIEVYFKNKEEPKKICFDYDLYLRVDDAVSNTRREKLTFQNPSNDFKKKLLKAGGVTNESNGSTKSSTEEKQNTSTTNSTKLTKAYVGNETKKSKSSGVIPSKDKSLNSQQSSTISPISPSVQEKHPINTSNKQFTDLFGTPIQARTSESTLVKNKDIFKAKKSPAIASKGVHNESKSNTKKIAKNSFLSPCNTSESKSEKDFKSTYKKESTKGKFIKEEVSDKQKKKDLLSNDESNDKKSSNTKESKKRRLSTSSNGSSITCGSYAANTESKQYKEHSPKLISSKDHENKKESKKRVSSKDVNTASGVKKHSSTSTKISFSNSNSSTTIEIKSVKKEKTWDSEGKKFKNKEFKSSEFKSAKENVSNNNSANSTNTPKSKVKEELNNQKSPKINGNKNIKEAKEKSSTLREASSSPSSGSLTPGGAALSSSSSIHGPLTAMFADMEQESLSPLSSDPTSTSPPLPYDRSNLKNNSIINYNNNNNNVSNNSCNNKNSIFTSDDSDSDVSSKKSTFHTKSPLSRVKPTNSFHSNSSQVQQLYKRKRDTAKESEQVCDTANDARKPSSSFSFHQSLAYNDLLDLQKRLNESTDSDLLQKIVDIIEESGIFSLTNTSFDFDLMKLDKTTLRKLKSFLN